MTNPGYKRFRPRWHRERMPIFWWLGQFSYIKFISRELTSLAVAYTAVFLVVQFWALSQGREVYGRLLEFLRSPGALVFHVLVFAVLLFHTVTWLNLAPKALVLHLGGRRIPDRAVLAAHYLAWVAACAAVAWVLLGGS